MRSTRSKRCAVRVDILVRVSSDMQVEAGSSEVHLNRALDYCKDHGYEINEIHRLEGVSGKATWDLPESQKIRYNIETGKAQGLVFSTLDRLGRDAFELLQFERFFRSQGAALISIFDNIDTSTSDGVRYFQGLATQAEYFRRRLSESVTRGILTRQKRGEIRTRKAPFGFEKRGRKLIPHPTEAPIVRLVFALYKDLGSLSSVANALNSQGFVTSAGGRFDATGIKRILANPATKGDYFANRKAVGNKSKPTEEWVKIAVPALVSVEDWEEVQAILRLNAKPKKRTLYAYSGLLRCECGPNMYTRKDCGVKYFCRSCGNKIMATDLDLAVGEVVNSFSLDQTPANLRIDYSIEYSAKSALLLSLSESLQKAQRDIDKLFELFTNDAIDLSEFKRRKGALEQTRQEAEQKKSELEFELTATKGMEQAEKILAESLSKLKWHEIPEAQKNILMKAFVKHITINRDTIELQLLYVPKSLNPQKV